MSTTDRKDHRALAETVRRRVLEGAGKTSTAVRRAAWAAATGDGPADTPAETLARLVGTASYRVTDAQVAAVVRLTGSEKATFEIVATAAAAAGLLRWQKAMDLLQEATDAPR
jgi:threonine synthase